MKCSFCDNEVEPPLTVCDACADLSKARRREFHEKIYGPASDDNRKAFIGLENTGKLFEWNNRLYIIHPPKMKIGDDKVIRLEAEARPFE